MWHSRFLAIGSLVAIFLILPVTRAVGQQTDPVVEALHKRMDTFFDKVKQSKETTAFDDLLNAGPLNALEARKELVTQTELIKRRYGAYRSHEAVYTKKVGSDLIFAKYLYKCETFPVLWHVTFYRMPSSSELSTDSSRDWQVVAIRFDTDLELLTLLNTDK